MVSALTSCTPPVAIESISPRVSDQGGPLSLIGLAAVPRHARRACRRVGVDLLESGGRIPCRDRRMREAGGALLGVAVVLILAA
jgi:hypothetical protein